MDAQERVRERLQRAMEGLLREFEADGTQPVDCEFIIHIGSQGLLDVSGNTIGVTDTLHHEDFPFEADSSGNGVQEDAPEFKLPNVLKLAKEKNKRK